MNQNLVSIEFSAETRLSGIRIGDREILKGASEFFIDTLVPEPKNGWLVTSPSMSPEHGGLVAGPTRLARGRHVGGE